MSKILELVLSGIFLPLPMERMLVMGIGGTLKRSATKASLQRPYNNQILTAQDFYEHRCEKITSVKCYFVPKEEVEAAFWHHGLRMLSPSPVLKRIILFPMDANNPMSPMDANFYVPHGCEKSHVPYPSI